MTRSVQNFASPLADGMKKFVGHKRVLGRRYETETYALRLFDRYLIAQGVASVDALTPALIEAFLATRPRSRPRSYNHLLGVLRRLFQWLVAREHLVRSPVLCPTRRGGSLRTPFVFAPGQARDLLGLAARLPDAPGAALRGPSYHAIFAILYGLGLRVGEVCRLDVADVDRQRQLLVIRETKFGKDRLVPYGPRLGATLDRYLVKRHASDRDLADNAPLFAGRAGGGSGGNRSGACSAHWSRRSDLQSPRAPSHRTSMIFAAALPCRRCCDGTAQASIPRNGCCTCRPSWDTFSQSPRPST